METISFSITLNKQQNVIPVAPKDYNSDSICPSHKEVASDAGPLLPQHCACTEVASYESRLL